jgi:hypothetical protein
MASHSDNRTVMLTTPARPDYVMLARLALSAVCRLAPLEPDEVADLKLAVTEAATYMMGGERRAVARDDQPVPTMRFEFELQDDRLVLGVAGEQLPTVSEEERELSRAIIAATVDDCVYDDGGVRLTRHLGRADE